MAVPFKQTSRQMGGVEARLLKGATLSQGTHNDQYRKIGSDLPAWPSLPHAPWGRDAPSSVGGCRPRIGSYHRSGIGQAIPAGP